MLTKIFCVVGREREKKISIFTEASLHTVLLKFSPACPWRRRRSGCRCIIHSCVRRPLVVLERNDAPINAEPWIRFLLLLSLEERRPRPAHFPGPWIRIKLSQDSTLSLNVGKLGFFCVCPTEGQVRHEVRAEARNYLFLQRLQSTYDLARFFLRGVWASIFMTANWIWGK